MKSIVFWGMTPCSPFSCTRRFGGTYRLHLQGRRIISVNQRATQRTKWCHIPKDDTLHLIVSFTITLDTPYLRIYRALPYVYKRVNAIIKISLTRNIYIWSINASGTHLWNSFCIVLKCQNLRSYIQNSRLRCIIKISILHSPYHIEDYNKRLWKS
jgi:hypothetical protein